MRDRGRFATCSALSCAAFAWLRAAPLDAHERNLPGFEAPGVRDQEQTDLSTGCGLERWAVKTGTDADATAVSLAPRWTTIAELTALPKAQDPPWTRRLSPVETTAWQLGDVTLLAYKRESDRDLHLLLEEGGRTLIAEIPDPSCVGPRSPFAVEISRARRAFEARFPDADHSYRRSGAKVSLRGIGFFDSDHSQVGRSENGIELHPVLDVCFEEDCLGKPPRPRGGCASAGTALPWLCLLAALAARRRQVPRPPGRL